MLVDRRTRGHSTLMVAAATFDPYSRSLQLAAEAVEDRGAWTTVALVLCGLLLFGVIAS